MRAYENGSSYRELASEHGVSLTPIQRILASHGVQPRRGRGEDKKPRRARASARSWQAFSNKEKSDIAQQFLAGRTQTALSEKFNCCPTTIGRILRNHGIPAGAHGQMRDRHHNWKGGRVVHPEGYVMVKPSHDDLIGQSMTGVKGYVLEHRLVMAHDLKRPLSDTETVHHKDSDRANNALNNLQIRHGKHGKGQALGCADCGSHNIISVGLADN